MDNILVKIIFVIIISWVLFLIWATTLGKKRAERRAAAEVATLHHSQGAEDKFKLALQTGNQAPNQIRPDLYDAYL